MLSQSTINKVLLLGKVVKEPRWHFESGEKVLCFTIMTTEKVRKNADYNLHEEHHNIRAGLDVVQDTQLQPGQLLYIQGKIQTRQFIDEEQIRRYKTEISALTIEVVSTPKAEPILNQVRHF